MNDTPNTAFAVLIKDSTNFVFLGEVTSCDVNFCAFPVVCRSICRKGISCKLCYTIKTLGVRVVVVVDRNDFVTTSFLQAINDMGT